MDRSKALKNCSHHVTSPASSPSSGLTTVSSTLEPLQSERVSQACDAIRSLWDERPSHAVILGSGLGGFVDALEVDVALPYSEIPHYSPTTVIGHAGRLVLGRIHDRPVIVLQGRCHLYEGHPRAAVEFPIHVLHALGVNRLIVSCAAGGLAPDWNVGELMIVDDHVDLQFVTALLRTDEPRQLRGRRIYCEAGQADCLRIARQAGVPARRGVYVSVRGPNYETRAEIRFLRQLGDAIGMSLVVEAELAARLGMQVIGLGLITNLCNPDRIATADGDHVVEAANQAEPRFRKVVSELLRGQD